MSSPKNIFILGGSGRVGQQVIANALLQGHHVTALVRKPNSLPPQPNLSQVTGSPTSSTDILNALTTISAQTTTNHRTKVTIITTLGQTRANPSNPWSKPTSPAYFMTASAEAVTTALRTLTTSSSSIEISKLIVLGAFGSGSSHQYMPWALRWVFAHTNMSYTLDDHNGILSVIADNFAAAASSSPTSDGDLRVPFVVVRPVMLKFDQPGEVPEIKEWGNGADGMGMFLGCDTRALAAFMVRAVESQEWDNTMPVISAMPAAA